MNTIAPNAILIDAITILPGRREIREEEVQTIAESMAAIGLQTPITVRREGGKYILVTGAHRLAAARKLEWKAVDCVVRDFASDADARLWEIAENLHRADLTVLERAEYVAEWERLNEGMATPKQVSQVETLAERAAQAVTSINKPSVADKLMAEVLNTEGRHVWPEDTVTHKTAPERAAKR
jgi:ParB/RepB/Spo0J family partition protein